MPKFRVRDTLPAEAYEKAVKLAVQIKNLAQNRSALIANGATLAEIWAIVDNATAMKNALNTFKAIPGIVEYADSQEGDASYNVGAGFLSMIASLDVLIDSIINDVTFAKVSFTAVQVSSVKSALDALDAVIVVQ